MRAVVLSLERRPDRLARFMGWNARHGLDFQVAAAVDGALLDRASLAAQGLVDDRHVLTDGALGNALSHRAQWLACVEEGAPRLICEDDACLHRSFPQQLPALARVLDHCDAVFFGYNTDAPLALMMPDQMMTEMYFGAVPGGEGDRYADFAVSTRPRLRSVPHPALMVWGTIAYAVSPAGARRLLDACFPLSAKQTVQFHVERRQVAPVALDGMINVALQAGRVRARACVPPLAISPNDRSDVSAASAFST